MNSAEYLNSVWQQADVQIGDVLLVHSTIARMIDLLYAKGLVAYEI
jgi:hypothetical protein